MRRLIDFKPIKQLELPGCGEIDCRGLIVIVGPNSSGKSQLLRDIYHTLSGEKRKHVVVSKLVLDKPSSDTFVECLIQEGLYEQVMDEQQRPMLRPRTTFLGVGTAMSEVSAGHVTSWLRSYAPDQERTSTGKSEFLANFGRLSVTALFLDRRLTAVQSVGVLDFDRQPPQTDLHSLFLHDQAKSELNHEIVAAFGKAVWPDTSRGQTMTLRVSETGQLPSAEDRRSYTKMKAYRQVEDEGDGLRSFVATALALLLGRRPLCLIDEPELCLHPPQAYQLGRLIGRRGTGNETATIVATHSSHVLRGIVQTATELQIVRLVRNDGQFFAHRIPASTVAQIVARPASKAENVLDGIFARGAVIVESDTDRLVYQTVWEKVAGANGPDLHFATVGGTGGIADVLRLYKTRSLPTAVVADLDLLLDLPTLERILESASIDDSSILDIAAKCTKIAAVLRELSPTISEADAKSALRRLSEDTLEWSKGHDFQLSRAIKLLAKDLDRLRALKVGGIPALAQPARGIVEAVVAQLREHGVFLVRVGELEQWLGAAPLGVSKSAKSRWAAAAASFIAEHDAMPGDIWAFVRDVGDYLHSMLRRSTASAAVGLPSS